jgi:ABC-type dipeptide/oligopeptide/nickel transport system permease subunit
MGRWVSPLEDPVAWFRSFIFPWITLALLYAAGYTRFTRSSVIEISSEDYIRTARAKGLNERDILRKHTLRAALAPIVTLAGLDFAGSEQCSMIMTFQQFLQRQSWRHPLWLLQTSWSISCMHISIHEYELLHDLKAIS